MGNVKIIVALRAILINKSQFIKLRKWNLRLKTTNLSGEENTYQVQLKTTEITKEVKK